MESLTQKIVVVTRRTRLDDLKARFNTIEQAKFYVEHLGADFTDYQSEHEAYQVALRLAHQLLTKFGQVQQLDRSFLPNFLFPPDALIVVIGQDGLVANTLKYLQGQAVVAVNPEPARWDGVLLPFVVKDLRRVVPEVLSGRRERRAVSMARARLSDGQTLHAVNDLFIGPKTHVSARYQIQVGGVQEFHSSSGLIVSTGLGSSGWFRSIITGAAAIGGIADGERTLLREQGFPWDSDYLYYSVREPFPSKQSQTTLVFGTVSKDEPLMLTSAMPDYGVIFSDGIEADFLAFNSGVKVTIDIADRQGQLVL